jgi:hypothetical protein
MTADTSAKQKQKTKGRSGVTNGNSLFLEGVDGRSALAKRYRDILSQLISDLGGDHPSEAMSLIARRAATLAVWCEQREAEMASNKDINIGEFTTAINSLRRLLTDIGLERRAKDITPSLSDYVKGKAA